MAAATRRLLLAGATGLVGRAVLMHLAERQQAGQPRGPVWALLRRPPDASLEGALSRADGHVLITMGLGPPLRLPPVDDALITLGTTIAVAGSHEAFRAVDLDLVVAVARAARDAGAKRLAVVSALGADANSNVFYNRVKGQMEGAVSALGFDSVVIARPSLLAGDRAALGQPARPGERWALRLLRPVQGLLPVSVRPIEAAVVARALLRTLDEGQPGRQVLPSAELARRGAV
ncbi:MAG TPA: hypothetical protein VFY73_16825 [Ideonella sp.]|uniref:hypothetical protein n=1 Tax=Ideonella sp. TaxID=1929293 RepID=UPI002E2F6D40|nr:hypothetical protein [Ideonella sp.]HEX5685688.1 hypothetical protein [Ideonella sp.]